jgi:hypothetical protein
MSRDLTAPVKTALCSSNFPSLVLVDLHFVSGHVRVTNASYTFTWDGYDWLGLGNLGSIDGVEEGTQLQMYGVALTLTGIPPEYISLAFSEEYQGRPATIYLAPLSEDYAILADPVIIFQGRMDTMDIEIGDTATITVTAESRLVDWERPRVRRYNNEDQQAAHSGDKGMEFVQQMVEMEIKWGRA